MARAGRRNETGRDRPVQGARRLRRASATPAPTGQRPNSRARVHARPAPALGCRSGADVDHRGIAPHRQDLTQQLPARSGQATRFPRAESVPRRGEQLHAHELLTAVSDCPVARPRTRRRAARAAGRRPHRRVAVVSACDARCTESVAPSGVPQCGQRGSPAVSSRPCPQRLQPEASSLSQGTIQRDGFGERPAKVCAVGWALPPCSFRLPVLPGCPKRPASVRPGFPVPGSTSRGLAVKVTRSHAFRDDILVGEPRPAPPGFAGIDATSSAETPWLEGPQCDVHFVVGHGEVRTHPGLVWQAVTCPWSALASHISSGMPRWRARAYTLRLVQVRNGLQSRCAVTILDEEEPGRTPAGSAADHA